MQQKCIISSQLRNGSTAFGRGQQRSHSEPNRASSPAELGFNFGTSQGLVDRPPKAPTQLLLCRPGNAMSMSQTERGSSHEVPHGFLQGLFSGFFWDFGAGSVPTVSALKVLCQSQKLSVYHATKDVGLIYVFSWVCARKTNRYMHVNTPVYTYTHLSHISLHYYVCIHVTHLVLQPAPIAYHRLLFPPVVRCCVAWKNKHLLCVCSGGSRYQIADQVGSGHNS